MVEAARVQSVDDIRAFRGVLVKFTEEAQTALISAEAELIRTASWLEGQQTAHWQDEVRKRTAIVGRCKDAIREKRLFKDSTGTYPSAHEEEKALRVAQHRLEEAEQKLAATKKYVRVLQREILLYKGQVQRFSTVAQVDLPQAIAWLDRVMMKLQAYAELRPGDERFGEAMALADQDVQETAQQAGQQTVQQAAQQVGAQGSGDSAKPTATDSAAAAADEPAAPDEAPAADEAAAADEAPAAGAGS
jgi:hypothetical protein